MTQKQLAESLKREFNLNYQIKGYNIYVNTDSDILNDIKLFVENINVKFNLGYKRFSILDKSKSIFSVPFGISIILKIK